MTPFGNLKIDFRNSVSEDPAEHLGFRVSPAYSSMSRVLSLFPQRPTVPNPLPLDLSDPLILRRLFPQPDSRNAIQHWENQGLGDEETWSPR